MQQDPQEAIDEAKRKSDETLAKVTFLFNVLMLVLKCVAAALSNSLAVISTVIDSGVDITSGLVIWLTVRLHSFSEAADGDVVLGFVYGVLFMGRVES